jgi:hypothetical protein
MNCRTRFGLAATEAMSGEGEYVALQEVREDEIVDRRGDGRIAGE